MAILNTWIFFDASSGVPIDQDSENVTSITDVAIGDCVLNFTTNYTTANFIVGGSGGGVGSSFGESIYTYGKAAGTVSLKYGTAGGGQDLPFAHCMITGTLV